MQYEAPYDALVAFSDHLLNGAWITIQVASLALVFGLLIGVFAASMRLSQFWIVRSMSYLYSSVIRAVPELIIILIIFFGGSVFINYMLRSAGWTPYYELSPFIAGVLALSLTYGAYASEVLRGAMLSVNKGELEAARAFGLSNRMIFFRVRLAQAWRYALPGLGNLSVIMLKDTSLLSVIGVHELMRETKVAINFTVQPFTFYMAAAVLYLLMFVVGTTLIRIMEKRASRGFVMNKNRNKYAL